MKDLGSLMKQAQGLQAKMADAQARLAVSSVTGTAGAGLVTLTLTGAGELKDVRIDARLLVSGEGETLQDLILAAHADAKARMEVLQAEMMRDAMGPLAGLAGQMPGLPGFK